MHGAPQCDRRPPTLHDADDGRVRRRRCRAHGRRAHVVALAEERNACLGLDWIRERDAGCRYAVLTGCDVPSPRQMTGALHSSTSGCPLSESAGNVLRGPLVALRPDRLRGDELLHGKVELPSRDAHALRDLLDTLALVSLHVLLQTRGELRNLS